MKRASPLLLVLLLCSLCAARSGTSQTTNSTLDITARITPTAARPEPARQVTFYVLSKSYRDICKEVEAEDAPPDREKFISDLKVSPQLKEWLREQDLLYLTAPNTDPLLTANELMD